MGSKGIESYHAVQAVLELCAAQAGHTPLHALAGGGGAIDLPLRVEHSTATYSWHFDQLYVSALLPIAKKLYLCKKHYFLGEDVLFYLF